MATVDYARIYRWKHGENSPNTKTLEKHLGALEAKLDEFERQLREALGVPLPMSLPLEIPASHAP
ncbi:MAG: hypothetical protein ACRCS9_13855 [Hyphomicrobium sp.]